MRLLRALAILALTIAAPSSAQLPQPVDLALVLAVDASGSVDRVRFELQKQGYVAAFRHPRVIGAIQSGPTQSIAIIMMQWTGPALQVTAVPWTKISYAVFCLKKKKKNATPTGRAMSGDTQFLELIHVTELYEHIT